MRIPWTIKARTTRPGPRRRRWPWALLALLVLGGLLWLGWWYYRTQLRLSPASQAWLASNHLVYNDKDAWMAHMRQWPSLAKNLYLHQANRSPAHSAETLEHVLNFNRPLRQWFVTDVLEPALAQAPDDLATRQALLLGALKLRYEGSDMAPLMARTCVDTLEQYLAPERHTRWWHPPWPRQALVTLELKLPTWTQFAKLHLAIRDVEAKLQLAIQDAEVAHYRRQEFWLKQGTESRYLPRVGTVSQATFQRLMNLAEQLQKMPTSNRNDYPRRPPWEALYALAAARVPNLPPEDFFGYRRLDGQQVFLPRSVAGKLVKDSECNPTLAREYLARYPVVLPKSGLGTFELGGYNNSRPDVFTELVTVARHLPPTTPELAPYIAPSAEAFARNCQVLDPRAVVPGDAWWQAWSLAYLRHWLGQPPSPSLQVAPAPSKQVMCPGFLLKHLPPADQPEFAARLAERALAQPSLLLGTGYGDPGWPYWVLATAPTAAWQELIDRQLSYLADPTRPHETEHLRWLIYLWWQPGAIGAGCRASLDHLLATDDRHGLAERLLPLLVALGPGITAPWRPLFMQRWHDLWLPAHLARGQPELPAWQVKPLRRDHAEDSRLDDEIRFLLWQQWAIARYPELHELVTPFRRHWARAWPADEWAATRERCLAWLQSHEDPIARHYLAMELALAWRFCEPKAQRDILGGFEPRHMGDDNLLVCAGLILASWLPASSQPMTFTADPKAMFDWSLAGPEREWVMGNLSIEECRKSQLNLDRPEVFTADDRYWEMIHKRLARLR